MWVRFAKRSHAPLSMRLLQEAQRAPFFETTTGIPFGLANHVWLGDEIYIPKEEIGGLQVACEERFLHEDYAALDDFAHRCEEALSALQSVTGRHGTGEASERFENWMAAYRGVMAFVPIFRIIDGMLSRVVGRGALVDSVNRAPETVEEEERGRVREIADLLRTAGDLTATSPTAVELVKAHAERFGWLGTRWFLGEPYGTDEIRARIVASMSMPPRSTREEAPASVDESTTREVERLVSRLAVLRTQRAEVANECIWRAGGLLEEVARGFGIPVRDVAFVLPAEFRDGRVPPVEVVGERREAFGSLLVRNSFSSVGGADAISHVRSDLGIDERALPGSRRDPNIQRLRGVAASPGRVTGPVRLVETSDDGDRVSPGDVLVTTMTFPSLVSAMARCGAIVTDDGGLLSHAAVTARELGKPCLIGTEVATSVLEEGEEVLVDCDAGFVLRHHDRRSV